MEDENKVKSFQPELDYIKNPKIRYFAERAIKIMPDYFFEIPASSTGKYHPQYSLGYGGLLRHTRAAVRIAIELFRMDWWKFTEDEMDLILVSLILHGWKSGIVQQKFSVADHPNIAFSTIKNSPVLEGILPQEQLDFVVNNIKTHMGQWTKDYKTGETVLDRPESKYQKFVHLADYLASRKCLEMKFDVELSKE